MNKILTIPLSFILFFALIGVIHSATYPTSSLHDLSDEEYSTNLTHEGENVDIVYVDDIVNGDGEPSSQIDVWGFEGALILLIGAIGLGIFTGVKVLGTGLSTYSQALIFKGTIFLTLWAIFSVFSMNILFSGEFEVYGMLIWVVLTVMYIIGFTQQISRSGGE